MHPNLTHLLEPIPPGLGWTFTGVTSLTLVLFFLASRQISGASWFVLGFIGWLAILFVLAEQSFFLKIDTLPPRLLFVLGPAILFITAMMATRWGKTFTEKASLEILTWLHTIRFPVELLLYGLYVQGQVPERMTFTGGNLDILIGLTAPVMAYCVFTRKWVSWQWLLAWNGVAVLLLLNVVIPAILAAPSVLQRIAFDQPNVAILKAPFIWLPGFVVPVVLLSHCITIARLIKSRRSAY
jgi:hypothetical protein